jgi:putative FmdB family regulatory protein
MPLFEFDCSECGAAFEKLVRRADAVSEVVCPACGSRKVSEKISAFASISKGGSNLTSGSSSCAPGGG